MPDIDSIVNGNTINSLFSNETSSSVSTDEEMEIERYHEQVFDLLSEVSADESESDVFMFELDEEISSDDDETDSDEESTEEYVFDWLQERLESP